MKPLSKKRPEPQCCDMCGPTWQKPGTRGALTRSAVAEQLPAGSSGLAAVEEQVERMERLAAAMERVCTEILLRISWLEADVKRLAAREREP